MTSSFRSKAIMTLFAACLSLLCWRVQGASAQAQKAAAPPPQKEEIPPDSDYMFRKYSAVIDEIKAKETDPQRRADALLAWVKNNPRATRAIAYAGSYYGEVVSGLIKAGDSQKALAMIQAFQAAAPADKTLNSLEMSAYYQTKNYAKAAEIGERMYAEKPSLEMANTLYTLYAQANNPDKMLVYGEKLVAEVPIDKSFGVALQLAGIYAQRKNNEKALNLFSQVMGVYGDKVPPGVQEAAWNTTRASAFSMIAADSYLKKDLPKAIELYEKVTRFASNGEEACQAWYYIGMAKWQGKDQKGAIEPFAKAYVLGKTLSPRAKENLDNLYKAEHNGSLDGLDAVISKAKSDLGIR
ncbi:MAG: tetratricopeptide repeat protein [Acidobacteriia bacterium]|nr:tetratricopeptide repeat protein [Terriglobia bacterium]